MKALQAFQVTVRGKSMWAVSLGKRAGFARRRRVFGDTKEEATRRAEDKLQETQVHGNAGHADISHTHRALIMDWRARLTPEEMSDAFEAFLKGKGLTRLVKDCVADYVAAKMKQDDRGKAAWSREQAKPANSRLKRFLAAFGDRIMGGLSPGELEVFIADQGGSASNYHRTLRAMFGHARRHRWIAKSPFDEMGAAPAWDGETKGLLTPAQFEKLLRLAAGLEAGHARKEPVLAAFILGGLAGLRTAEVLRLTWGKVDLEGGRLTLGRDTTRKRGLRGRVVELDPAALAWLRTLQPGEPGERVVKLSEKNFRDGRSSIAAAAGLAAWPDNVLRRSFASHHLPLHESGAKTAYVMGHTDAGTTFAKYRVPASRQAGEAWFAIMPSAGAAGE